MKHPRTIVIATDRDDVIAFARGNDIDLAHVIWIGERVRLHGLRPAPGERVFTIGGLEDDLREAVRAWADHCHVALERVKRNDVFVAAGRTVCGPDH